jgi:hypothetical protein
MLQSLLAEDETNLAALDRQPEKKQGL